MLCLCKFCGEEVDPAAVSRWQMVVGWQRMAGVRASGKHGGSDIVLREKMQQWAHSACIILERSAANTDQMRLL